MKYISIVFVFLFKIKNRILEFIIKWSFSSFGRNFRFDPHGSYSFSTISVGDDVYIGPGAVIISDKRVIIESKVLIGPNVTIVGGDHRIDVVGRYIYDVRDKLEHNDQIIVIESDVWIGSNVTILKGVTVGACSVIGAGALLTKSVPKNSVVFGSSSIVKRSRFSEQDFATHLDLLDSV